MHIVTDRHKVSRISGQPSCCVHELSEVKHRSSLTYEASAARCAEVEVAVMSTSSSCPRGLLRDGLRVEHLSSTGALRAVHEREDRFTEHLRSQVLRNYVGDLCTCE